MKYENLEAANALCKKIKQEKARLAELKSPVMVDIEIDSDGFKVADIELDNPQDELYSLGQVFLGKVVKHYEGKLAKMIIELEEL